MHAYMYFLESFLNWQAAELPQR